MAETETMGPSNAQASDNVDNNQKVGELKKELQRLSLDIIGDNQEDNDGNDSTENDHGVITINKAIQTLTALKMLNLKKKKQPLSSPFDHLDIPDEFICPISKEIMKDPVILATGQTYDRPFIHRWLKDVHRTCPQTQQVLSHVVLTPNHLVRELIEQWCKDHSIQLPPPVTDHDEEVIRLVTNSDRDHLNGLLDRLSSTLSDQKQAAKEIRILTKRTPSIRSTFVESADTIPQLLSPLLPSENLDKHPDLQEDLITSLFNISIHEDNKQIIGEHPLVIRLLVESLTRGTIETRSNAAAALFTLSALDSNKVLIGKAYALEPLIDLLEANHPLAMKDAASAIFSLCKFVENRGRAVGGGAIRVILSMIRDGVLVDELLSILAMLATHEDAIKELVDLRAVNCLLSIIKDSTCERSKENCINVLNSICRKNRAVLKEVEDEEKAHCTISKLAEQGSSGAKRKANRLLDRFHRGTN